MAKKPERGSATETQRRRVAKNENSLGGASVPASRSLQTATDKTTAREDTRPTKLKPSSLLDTRVIYCGDNLEQLAKLPDACNSAFRIRHSAIELTGSFYYHCDWHASHYIKVMLGICLLPCVK